MIHSNRAYLEFWKHTISLTACWLLWYFLAIRLSSSSSSSFFYPSLYRILLSPGHRKCVHMKWTRTVKMRRHMSAWEANVLISVWASTWDEASLVKRINEFPYWKCELYVLEIIEIYANATICSDQMQKIWIVQREWNWNERSLERQTKQIEWVKKRQRWRVWAQPKMQVQTEIQK